MYGDMQNEFEKIKNEMQEGFTGVNERIDKLEDKVTIIENDHGKKLDVLLDGYKQNSDKLSSVEKEVSRQEEVILRKIR